MLIFLLVSCLAEDVSNPRLVGLDHEMEENRGDLVIKRILGISRKKISSSTSLVGNRSEKYTSICLLCLKYFTCIFINSPESINCLFCLQKVVPNKRKGSFICKVGVAGTRAALADGCRTDRSRSQAG